MVFLWFSYGFPIKTSIFLWFSYGFPMVFPLKPPFSYGFPMVFYGFPGGFGWTQATFRWPEKFNPSPSQVWPKCRVTPALLQRWSRRSAMDEILVLQGIPSWRCHGNHGNFRILKWRYCTIFLAIFCGDIPLHRPYIGLIYGTSNLGSWNGHWWEHAMGISYGEISLEYDWTIMNGTFNGNCHGDSWGYNMI